MSIPIPSEAPDTKTENGTKKGEVGSQYAGASYSYTRSMSQHFLWTSLFLGTFKRTYSRENGSFASPKCAYKSQQTKEEN